MEEEPDSLYEEERRSSQSKQAAKNSSGGGIIGFIIFCIIVWFFFFRTDYSKPWIKEGNEEYATVVWCQNGNCFSGDHVYNLNVYYDGKAAYGDNRHILVIYMPNGGEVETNVYCAKNENKLISHKRYCEGVDNDGEIWRFYPKD